MAAKGSFAAFCLHDRYADEVNFDSIGANGRNGFVGKTSFVEPDQEIYRLI